VDRKNKASSLTGTSRRCAVRFGGITISRCEDGLLVEEWSVTGALGLLRCASAAPGTRSCRPQVPLPAGQVARRRPLTGACYDRPVTMKREDVLRWIEGHRAAAARAEEIEEVPMCPHDAFRGAMELIDLDPALFDALDPEREEGVEAARAAWARLLAHLR